MNDADDLRHHSQDAAAPVAASQVSPSETRLVGSRPARTEWLVFAAAIGLLTLAHLAHLNGFWALAGDGDFYLAMARNWYQGEGLWHNGQPARTVPPGWPVLLGTAIGVTPKLVSLKLINIACLITFLAAVFRAGRRVASLRAVAIATVVVGLAPDVIAMGWQFLSDPPFCAAAGLALLAACKAGEAEQGGLAWIVYLLTAALFACIAMTMRWTGVLALPLYAGALFHRQRFWHASTVPQWIGFAVLAASVLAVFQLQRAMLPLDEAELAARVDQRYPAFMVGSYDLINQHNDPGILDFAERFSGSGRYVSSLVWEPLATMKLTHGFVDRAGWLVWIVAAGGIVVATRHRRWLALGAALYCLPVMITWPQAIERYLLLAMPIVFALALDGVVPTVVGFSRVVRQLNDRVGVVASSWLLSAGRRLAVGIVVATLSLEIAMLAMTVNVFRGPMDQAKRARNPGTTRAGNFGDRFSGGVYRGLPAIAEWIDRRGTPGSEIGVSEGNYNLGRTTYVHGWMRALHLLTDRPIQPVPPKFSKPLESSQDTVDWLRRNNVRYYVYFPKHSRALHFRGGQMERSLFTGQSPYSVSQARMSDEDWRLYEIDLDPAMTYVALPKPGEEVGWRRVPISVRGIEPWRGVWPRRVPFVHGPRWEVQPPPVGLLRPTKEEAT